MFLVITDIAEKTATGSIILWVFIHQSRVVSEFLIFSQMPLFLIKCVGIFCKMLRKFSLQHHDLLTTVFHFGLHLVVFAAADAEVL